MEDEKVLSKKAESNNLDKTPAFIIIDVTWKEARKSDYLKKLPFISLEPSFKSEYDLRGGAKEGNLCTIEAAIEALKINDEIQNVQIIKGVFNLFSKSYTADSTSHKLTE